MSCLELIFKNVSVKELDFLFTELLVIESSHIVSSHFYDDKYNIDIEYNDIDSFSNYFSNSGTCSMVLRKINIGIWVQEAIIVIASEGDLCDITINFEVNQFLNCKEKIYIKNLSVMINKVILLCQLINIEYAIIGYEPAEDIDMTLVKISKDVLILFNETIFNDEISNAIYDVVKKIQINL